MMAKSILHKHFLAQRVWQIDMTGTGIKMPLRRQETFPKLLLIWQPFLFDNMVALSNADILLDPPVPTKLRRPLEKFQGVWKVKGSRIGIVGWNLNALFMANFFHSEGILKYKHLHGGIRAEGATCMDQVSNCVSCTICTWMEQTTSKVGSTSTSRAMLLGNSHTTRASCFAYAVYFSFVFCSTAMDCRDPVEILGH